MLNTVAQAELFRMKSDVYVVVEALSRRLEDRRPLLAKSGIGSFNIVED